MSDLVKNLETNLKSKKSYDQYVARIRKLEEIVGKDIRYIIYHAEEVYAKLKDHYPNVNTRKNAMTTILSLIRVNPKVSETPEGQKSKAQWKKYHDDLNIVQRIRVKQNRMPEKVREKYVSFEEVEVKVRELSKADPHRSFDDSQKYLLLTVLTDIKPKRSDMGAMKIYRNKDPNTKDENYVVLRDKISEPSYFVFQVYKTDKYYGRIEEDMGAETVKVLKASLRRYPREYMFMDRFRRPFQSNNSYGQFVQRVFTEYFGKEVGTSIWRHIFRIEKMGDNISDEERAEWSRLMMHSEKVNNQYRWVKEGNQVCYVHCENK